MSNKTVLIVINDLDFFISHRLDIAKKLISQNKKVYLVSKYSDNYRHLIDNKIEFIQLNINRSKINIFQELFTIFQLYKIIKTLEPDLMHLITLKPIIYGSILNHFLKINKIVCSITGMGTLYSHNKNKNILKQIIKLIMKICFKNKNMTFIVQNSQDKKLIEKYNNNIFLIEGSGVDPNHFPHKEENLDSFNILLSTRLLKEKGVYEYIEMANILKKKYPYINFWLSGKIDTDNPSHIKLKDLDIISKKGVISYLGFEKNMSKLINESNIFIYPSYYGEGLAKVLIEVAMSGRPIITTNLPGCRESIINNITGFLVKPMNVHQLVEFCEKLITNNYLRQKMGKNARKFALSKFNLSQVVKKHIEIYDL